MSARYVQNVHIVLWMLKDYAWNSECKWLWLVVSPPTILIGIDFVLTTAVAGETLHFLFAHCLN
jgi:hypothetical protein